MDELELMACDRCGRTGLSPKFTTKHGWLCRSCLEDVAKERRTLACGG